MNQAARIVYCHCQQAGVVPAGVRRVVLERLAAAGIEFDALADLCAASAGRDPLLRSIAEAAPIRVAACHPRAVRSLFEAAGASLPDEGAELIDMRADGAEAVVKRLLAGPAAAPRRDATRPGKEAPPRLGLHEGPGAESLTDDERLGILRALLDHGVDVSRVLDADARSANGGAHTPALLIGRFGRDPDGAAGPEVSAPAARRLDIEGRRPEDLLRALGVIGGRTRERGTAGRPAWFPVIDMQRCNHCGQCLSFCLFGVYDQDDAGRVRVVEPAHCKPDCPACARVCPELAIIFPKVAEAPINGAPVRADDLRVRPAKRNLSALFGRGLGPGSDSVRQRGATRRTRRFAADRDPEEARAERRRRLAAALRLQRPVGRPNRRLDPAAEPSPTADDWGI